MPSRKILLKSQAGVHLERIEELSRQGRVQQTRYRLSTPRPDPTRILARERDALDAFDLEVIASLSDPATAKLADDRPV